MTFDDLFAGQSVMAVLRSYPPREAVALATSAWDLGIRAVEVPIQTADAVRSLSAVVDAGRERGMPVGAGTVISSEHVHAAREAGAAFTVAPGLDLSIASMSANAGMPHMPGVATGSEIQQATIHQMIWLKAFPAGALGPAWFRLMRAPFPAVNFVATGGVSSANAPSFLAAGARVVAVGSALRDPDQLGELSDLLSREANASFPDDSC